MSIYFQGGAEFVFPSDSKKKRSLGEQMFTGVGTSYMCGMFVKTFTLHFPANACNKQQEKLRWTLLSITSTLRENLDDTYTYQILLHSFFLLFNFILNFHFLLSSTVFHFDFVSTQQV